MIPHPDTPVWNGPYKGGITQSHLLRFMECPFRAYLYFICGLKETTAPHENLIWGSTIHKGLEHLIRGDSLADSQTYMYGYIQKEYPAEPLETFYTCYEMLKLYNTHVLPGFKDWNNPLTEHRLDTTIHLPREVRVRGMVDVTDFFKLCDHKAKGSIYPTETAEELGQDLQMNLYAYVLGVEHWQYDLIQCPLKAYRCPAKKPGETSDSYADRLFYRHDDYKWKFPISQFASSWICPIPYFQPKEENHKYFNETIKPLMNRFCDWWDYVTSPDFNPNAPECYNHLFYRMPARVFDPSRTDKFKPHYHSILIGTDTVDSLVPVTNFYPELEDK